MEDAQFLCYPLFGQAKCEVLSYRFFKVAIILISVEPRLYLLVQKERVDKPTCPFLDFTLVISHLVGF